MSKVPKISVIIPCYNMGDFVVDAIESVLSYPLQEEVEVIVVNDGSDDNDYTRKLLDTFTQPNVTVIHQENKGLGNARNTAIKNAKAKYVLPLDADNKIRHNYVVDGIRLLDENPEIAIVYGDNKKMGLRTDVVTIGELDIVELIRKNYIDACVVLRKSAWEAVGGYDEKMPVMGYEDWDLNLRLIFKGWNFSYLNEVCFDYMVREDSMLIYSNNNRDVLNDYIFSKPELIQAARLRKVVEAHDIYKLECESMKKRKVVSFALKVEKLLKTFIKKK
jgi:glycosyltransferase involved in cell wall biosynthesis